MRTAAPALVLTLALTLAGGGCSLFSTSRTVGKGSLIGLVDGIGALDPESKRKAFEGLAGSVDLKRAAHDLAQSAVTGVADGLNQSELERHVDQLVRALMLALRQSGDETLTGLLEAAGPQLDKTLHAALNRTMADVRGLLTEVATRDVELATRNVVRTAVQTFATTLESASAGAAGKIAPPAGEIARTVTREAVRGFEEGLDAARLHEVASEAGRGLAEGIDKAIGLHGSLRSGVETGVIAASAVLGGLLLLSVFGLWHLWKHYRSSTKSLSIVAQKINEVSSEHPEAGRKLKDAIHESAKKNNAHDWLSNFLKHRGL
jgi:hypothetical protein